MALRHVKAPARPSDGRGRDSIFALIRALMPPQGHLSIERMCALAGVSSAATTGFDAARRSGRRKPLRDTLQWLALAHRFYGSRRLTESVRREGSAVNHKRVPRLMRTNNLLALRRRAFVPPGRRFPVLTSPQRAVNQRREDSIRSPCRQKDLS